MSRRDKTARHHLLRLMYKHHGRCVDCGDQLMMSKDAMRLGHFVNHGAYIKLKTGGKIKMATVEHIQRIIDGGKNDKDNLTLLCMICNCQRNNKIERDRKENEKMVNNGRGDGNL